ncbi:MAG TPA: efflux RND transporter periplasmic adaptor subunit [Steroidobacteraceae bacterium]
MQKRRRPWGLLVVALAVAGLFAWLALGRHQRMPEPAAQSVSVSAAMANRADVPVALEAIGAAQAWQADVIHAQVSGRLLSVPVSEGSEVKAGDLLAQIDAAPFQAALMQTVGTLKHDQAQLKLAQLDLQRYRALLLQDSVASQQVDTQAALVEELEGMVIADQGLVNAARVNLGYCTIRSPVTGRVGVRLVDAGNLVTPTDPNGIITVDQLKPMAVTFSVAEGDFERLRQASETFSRALATLAYSQDTDALLGSGELRIADNHVDPSTGTVQLKARFPNTDGKLWPGQFVNVRLTINSLHDVLTIPNAAVNHGPAQTYVYVIGPDSHVAVRPIQVALVQDAWAVISSGLQSGDEVVTDGQGDLKPGALVIVRGPIEREPAAPLAQDPARTAPVPSTNVDQHRGAVAHRS